MARKKPNVAQQQQANIQEPAPSTISGTNISKGPYVPHRGWQNFPQVQSELFYECTLFLYSILALFVEYLNLYKTLWWLPKSHVSSTFKFHLINPYVLSCVGLLLGIRVVKCFWDTITKKFNEINADDSSNCMSLTEYALIKTPLFTMIATSFVFSFSRIYSEYETLSIFYLFCPLFVYLLIFHNYIRESLQTVYRRWWMRGGDFFTIFTELAYFHLPDGPSIFDDKHVCNVEDRKEFWREAILLWKEIDYRFWSCVYIGFHTAYYSVFLPTVFLPKKTKSGLEQEYLTESHWLHLMFFTVFVTSFFLYALYQFPMELIDRLYQCAAHLGSWKELRSGEVEDQQVILWDGNARSFHKHNDIIHNFIQPNGGWLCAQRHKHFDQVSSSPGNPLHRSIYRLGKDPVVLIRNACMAQAVLIAFQFYALVMATDWQHIFTLVLLMFTNYLLFGKFFKDYVIVSHIYSDHRKGVDGAPFPINGKHLNEKGEYAPQAYEKIEY